MSKQYPNLVAMQEDRCRENADRPMFGNKINGEWQWLTFGEFAERVNEMRSGLESLGVGKGDRVAIISTNSIEWAVAAYATYGRGAFFTAMYEDQLPKDWKFILEDCGAKVVIGNGDTICGKLKDFPAEIDTLEHVINTQGTGAGTYAGLIEHGKANPVASVQPDTDDLMGLIYTSGTTGKPKGVMLSHGNLMSNFMAVDELLEFTADDRSLSFLPWAHIFGQMAELHALIFIGYSAAFVSEIPKLVEELQEVKPTILFSVPRIFNRIYDMVNARIRDKGGFALTLLNDGMAAASKKRAGESLSMGEKIKLAMANKIIFSKIRDTFGGRLKFCVSGAAALNKDVAEFIANLGITVYEGYGLSETSPMVSANSKAGIKIGSVGKVVPGCRVVIDTAATNSDIGDGEIVVYGPNVMKGYYNRPEATAEVMTADGGFRTGDLGRIDDEDFLHITGRIKEQYKLENGKYVVPAPLEEAMQISPYIEQVLVYGDNRLFNIAIIVPNMDALGKWAKAEDISETGSALLGNAQVNALYETELESVCGEMKGFERPKKFAFSEEPWTPDNGMMTPTMKLKRPIVVQALQSQIDALYG